MTFCLFSGVVTSVALIASSAKSSVIYLSICYHLHSMIIWFQESTCTGYFKSELQRYIWMEITFHWEVSDLCVCFFCMFVCLFLFYFCISCGPCLGLPTLTPLALGSSSKRTWVHMNPLKGGPSHNLCIPVVFWFLKHQMRVTRTANGTHFQEVYIAVGWSSNWTYVFHLCRGVIYLQITKCHEIMWKHVYRLISEI